jgi:hypothetical protein
VVSTALGEAPQFNLDIRPILADRCFACHGPDSGTREAELRLDSYEGATESVVVPGNADSSELIARVSSDEPEYRMPPADSKKPPLMRKEVQLLRDWINSGARYEPHWSYIPPERPAVPVGAASRAAPNAAPRSGPPRLGGPTVGSTWPRNPIDRFLLAKMQARGIAPSLEAAPATLVRRLYFDLTGLPPSPAEIDKFLLDNRPDAYDTCVWRADGDVVV